MENKETFFELLKQHRESQNIEISDICEFTKINSKYIEAIEVGDFTVLPTVYMRLFIKAYAHFIKSDHIKALEDYEVFTTGKILDNSNLNAVSSNNSTPAESIITPETQKLPQIRPQKIATVLIVATGLIIALFWASKITNEQNKQPAQETVENNSVFETHSIEDSIKMIAPQNSNPKADIKKPNELKNLNTEKDASFISNSYLIEDREYESTDIIQLSPPYEMSVRAIQKTRLNISKSNLDDSKVLINEIIAKNEKLNFNFESIINFDFINNSHVSVALNGISLDNFLSNNGLAIRGSYKVENSQLYIGFYKSN